MVRSFFYSMIWVQLKGAGVDQGVLLGLWRGHGGLIRYKNENWSMSSPGLV